MKIARRIDRNRASAIIACALALATGCSSTGTGSGGMSSAGFTASNGGAGASASGMSGTVGGAPNGGAPNGGAPSGGNASTQGGTAGAYATGGAAGDSVSGGAANPSGGARAIGGQAGSTGQPAGAAGSGGGGVVSGCVGNAWPTADPTTAGPFQVTTDKDVGPLAGVVPDPVYGDKQQRFNVYRPKDLTQGGFCHPILVWANGHTDNPEPKPPECVSSKYCGSYLMLMNQLASHGFVVIASLSTITSQGTPLPTIVGLDWLIQQADDPASPYYHHLDTAHVGALGHSEGGFSTSKAASDPRISATATVSGSAVNAGIHGPSLWFCGGKDTVVSCDSVSKTYSAITTLPAMFVNNLAADHGGWLYQNGIKGPDIFGFTAWFRVHLMADTANRKLFYGPNCTLCTDSRVQVMRNSFLTQ